MGQSQMGQNEDQLPKEFRRFFGPGNQFEFFGPGTPRQPQIEHGMGSGVVISPDGYIVTNNHVIEGAVDIRVTTSNRHVMKAMLVGAGPMADLTVLNVDGND